MVKQNKMDWASFSKCFIKSQFEPGTSNVKANFIKRNELIAMLSEKIVVVQASKDSGALHTAKYGFEYNKEVYAVPGTIYDKCSLGSNMLITKGAKLLVIMFYI